MNEPKTTGGSPDAGSRVDFGLRALLGAVLAEPTYWEAVEPVLDVHEPYMQHADVGVLVAFRCIRNMPEPSTQISIAELAADISESSDVPLGLTLDVLTQLRRAQEGLSNPSLQQRIKKVDSRAKRWRMGGILKQGAENIDKGSHDPDEFAQAISDGMTSALMGASEVDYDDISSDIAADLLDPEKIVTRAMTTGFRFGKIDGAPHPSDLDAVIRNGFARKQTVCIGAPTNGGKGLFACAIGRNYLLPHSARYFGAGRQERLNRTIIEENDSNGPHLLIVSTEQPRADYYTRIQQDILDCLGTQLDDKSERVRLFAGPNSEISGRLSDVVKSGRLTVIDRDILRGKNKTASGRELPLVLMHVRRWVRQKRARYGDIDLAVIIDYGQKIELPLIESKGQNREVINARISSAVYDIAVDLDIAAVVMLQLNGRLGKQSADNDVRESGAWDMDADVSMKLDSLTKDEVTVLERLHKSGDDRPPALTDELFKWAPQLMHVVIPKGRGSGGGDVWFQVHKRNTRIVAVPDEAHALLDADPLKQARDIIRAATTYTKKRERAGS